MYIIRRFCMVILGRIGCAAVLLGSLLSCNGGGTGSADNNIHSVSGGQISGYVQKGPYINGSSVTLSELNESFSQTGKTFSTTMNDNNGTFEIRDIDLNSQYVLLKADGYYFDEVADAVSSAPLTLYAYCDISDRSAVNVNIISRLEKGRVEYLLSRGYSFRDAKSAAKRDVLKIFGINKPAIGDSVALDISKDGDDNAVLLAVSLILQGFRTPGDLMQLLADIDNDIREDGVLNNQALGSALISDAKLLDLSAIRANLERRYEGLGASATIPDFESHVTFFVQNSDFAAVNGIVYPGTGLYGDNILSGNSNTFASNQVYSFAADLATGTSLTIMMKGGLWFIASGSERNWLVSNYSDEKSQTFTAIESGKSSDSKMMLTPGRITIEYYENKATTPTRTRVISVTGESAPAPTTRY